MKKYCYILLCFCLLLIPTALFAAPYAGSLGTLTEGTVTLELNGMKLKTYQVFDTHYVPLFKLKEAGCTIAYDSVTKYTTLTLGTAPLTSENLTETSLNGRSFSLHNAPIYIGNFKTQGLLSEGRILIPIGALRQLYDITINGLDYKITPKKELEVRAYADKIENKMAETVNVTIVDLYFNGTLMSEKSDYTLSPYQRVPRNINLTDPNEIYIATVILGVSGPSVDYKNTNMYGQVNDPLFPRYAFLSNNKPLTDLGDPIDLETVLWAEDFVNTKKISSDTRYLVWTDLNGQKTFIFEKQNNAWKLLKNFLCSTGKASSPTPKGTFKLTTRVPRFGQNKGYTCKNAFGFIGTTYLYHSVMFDKTGTYLLEGKGVLGKTASAGCIRFSPENSEWFYKHMISGTTVWIN